MGAILNTMVHSILKVIWIAVIIQTAAVYAIVDTAFAHLRYGLFRELRWLATKFQGG